MFIYSLDLTGYMDISKQQVTFPTQEPAPNSTLPMVLCPREWSPRYSYYKRQTAKKNSSSTQSLPTSHQDLKDLSVDNASKSRAPIPRLTVAVWHPFPRWNRCLTPGFRVHVSRYLVPLVIKNKGRTIEISCKSRVLITILQCAWSGHSDVIT